MSDKQPKTKKPRITMTVKTNPHLGWSIKATGITLIEPCEEPGIHIECNSTIKEVRDVSISMGEGGISMYLPTKEPGATIKMAKNVKCGVELATNSSSVNMFTM